MISSKKIRSLVMFAVLMSNISTSTISNSVYADDEINSENDSSFINNESRESSTQESINSEFVPTEDSGETKVSSQQETTLTEGSEATKDPNQSETNSSENSEEAKISSQSETIPAENENDASTRNPIVNPTAGGVVPYTRGEFWSIFMGGLPTKNVPSGSFYFSGMIAGYGQFPSDTLLIPSQINYSGQSRNVFLDRTFFTSLKEFIRKNPRIKKIKLGDDIFHPVSMETTNIQPSYLNDMFSDLWQLESIDLSCFIMSSAPGNSVERMFSGCTGLKEVKLNPTFTRGKTEFSSMFENCNNLTSIDFGNTVFPRQVINASRMFYTSELTPLIIYSNNQNLKEYFNSINSWGVVDKDNRYVGGPMFNANGGRFNDGTQSKKYFDNIVVSKSRVDLSSFNDFKNSLVNEVKKENFDFLDWKLTSGKDPVSNDDLLKEITYTAQWGSKTVKVGNIPSEKDNSKQTGIFDFGIAYFPKLFSFPKTELSNNSNKQVINIGEDTNYHVAVLSNNKSHWNLQAKLVWDKDSLKDNSYIQFSNLSGQVTQNTNDGTSKFTNSDLKPISEGITGKKSLQINTKDFEDVMVFNTNKKMNGVYDYSLGQASLVLENPSKIAKGNYTGTIVWNLSSTP